jgi:hypothetical protein
MKKINIIFIDTVNMDVKRLDNFEPTLQNMYNLIGCELIESTAYLGDRFLYVDEEGLLKSPTKFFMVDWYPHPLAGNAIMLMIDRDGNSKSCELYPDQIEHQIRFMELSDIIEWNKNRK